MNTIKALEARRQAHHAAALPEERALATGLITRAERNELDLRHQASKRALEIQARKLQSACIFCDQPAAPGLPTADWDLCAPCYEAIAGPWPGEIEALY